MKTNKNLIAALLGLIFMGVETFAGSFYTATLFPNENVQDVKSVLNRKSFYICSKDGDSYSLVTEKQMDSQRISTIKKILTNLSSKISKPIVSYVVFDSDALTFFIYKNGKEVFTFDSTGDYFNGLDLIIDGVDNVPKLFKIDAKKWKNTVSEENFRKYIFVEEFLDSILDMLGMPDWTNGIGYYYLNDDSETIELLQEEGIDVEFVTDSRKK